MAGHRATSSSLLCPPEKPVHAGGTATVAIGLLPDDFFNDGDFGAVHGGLVQQEGRLSVASRHAFEKFGRRGNIAAHGGMGPRVHRILEHEPGSVRHGARGAQRKMGHLVHLIGEAVHV